MEGSESAVDRRSETLPFPPGEPVHLAALFCQTSQGDRVASDSRVVTRPRQGSCFVTRASLIAPNLPP